MIRLTTLILAAIASAALLVACGTDSDTDIEISNAWARTTAPTQTSGAIYANIVSEEGDRLIGASVPTDVAAITEIHESVASEPESGMDEMDESHMGEDSPMTQDGDEMHGSGDGMMMMREVSGIDLPAGETVALEPGGFHVMLIDLAGPIEEGESIALTLTFENAGDIEVDVEAKDG